MEATLHRQSSPHFSLMPYQELTQIHQYFVLLIFLLMYPTGCEQPKSVTVVHIPVTSLMIHACLAMEGEKLKWASSPGEQLRALQIGVSVPVVEEAVM